MAPRKSRRIIARVRGGTGVVPDTDLAAPVRVRAAIGVVRYAIESHPAMLLQNFANGGELDDGLNQED